MMSPEQRKQLWLWHVGPLADLRPMAPDRQTLDLNGMRVDYYRQSKRHYELTFHTSDGPVTLVCREPNGYKRILECDWFPKHATAAQQSEIQSHCDEL
jgi:hypothetical protein